LSQTVPIPEDGEGLSVVQHVAPTNWIDDFFLVYPCPAPHRTKRFLAAVALQGISARKT